MSEEIITPGALAMGFSTLVAVLEARSILPTGEVAERLESAADGFGAGLRSEMLVLAAALRGRIPPTLTAIKGGKDDE